MEAGLFLIIRVGTSCIEWLALKLGSYLMQFAHPNGLSRSLASYTSSLLWRVRHNLTGRLSCLRPKWLG